MEAVKDFAQNRRQLSLSEGFPFRINITYKKRKGGILGYFQKADIVKEARKFVIKEPTLEVLDRIASLSDGIDPGSHDAINYKKMARIIAIAVAEDTAQESSLSKVFFKCLKPSELTQIIEVVDLVSNHTDFMNAALSVTAKSPIK